MIKLFFKKKGVVVDKNFFDYSAKEKKKLIVKAAKEANKMQLDLVKKYNVLYCK